MLTVPGTSWLLQSSVLQHCIAVAELNTPRLKDPFKQFCGQKHLLNCVVLVMLPKKQQQQNMLIIYLLNLFYLTYFQFSSSLTSLTSFVFSYRLHLSS